MLKSLLIFNNFSFRYKKEEDYIFKDVSFSIFSKSINFVIGKNGSGKTTLIKAIFYNYIYNFYQGFIKINTNSIGFIRDFHNFYNNLTVLQNLKLYFELSKGNQMLNTQEFYKYIDLFFGYFAIEKDYLSKNINELSFGYKQKILIIRELITFKELILIDEPFLGLDYYSYCAFLKILLDFYNKISFIIFTQNPNVILDLQKLINESKLSLELSELKLNSDITLFSFKDT
jgi:ABC-type multidrug transport system ATPase subunit